MTTPRTAPATAAAPTQDRIDDAAALLAGGRYDAAEETLSAALRLAEENGSGPLERAGLHALMAELEAVRGRHVDAEAQARRVLRLRRQALELHHHDVLVAQASLGALLVPQAKYDEAEPLLRESIRRFEATLGPSVFEIAGAANSLAALLTATGRLEEAAGWYRRVLAIKAAVLGATHPAVATTLHNLAVVFESAGRADDAAAVWAEARRLLEISAEPVALSDDTDIVLADDTEGVHLDRP